MTDPLVKVILLNWNDYLGTRKCIKNILSVEYKNLDVIVVDNGSNDNSGERLKREFPDLNIIQNSYNLGFAGGVNVGIQAAMSKSADYILLLNTDVIVSSDFITKMVRECENNNNIGIVGIKILYSESNTIHDAGRVLDYKKNKLKSPSKNKHTSEVSGTIQRDVVTGACMLVEPQLIRDIGLFDDDNFFFGGEDVDFCIRAMRASWQIVVTADSQIWHEIGGVSGSYSKFREYNSTRNSLNLVRKHDEFHEYSYIYTLFSDILKIIDKILDREFSDILAILTAYFDFILHSTKQRYKP